MRRRTFAKVVAAAGTSLVVPLRAFAQSDPGTATPTIAEDATTAQSGHAPATDFAAAGPLVVSTANPRYFTIGPGNAADGRVVYLTGSHIWNNFHDGLGPGAGCAETPEQNDYDAYLAFLKDHGHNFIRLWRWEQFKSQAAGGAFHLCMTPQPWARTGAGEATDGKPKFDLSTFDQAYFDRLRDRVVAAGNEGIYVAVMLFDGFGLHLSPAPDNVEGHPFHAANNVNGIDITSIDDYQVLPLDPRVQDAPGGVHQAGHRHRPRSAQRSLSRSRTSRRAGAPSTRRSRSRWACPRPTSRRAIPPSGSTG